MTSHIIKIFKRVLRRHVVQYFKDKSLLNPGQHGFRAAKSCLSQLLKHYDTILQMLESSKSVDVIYLDFAKAFDKVDFDIVLEKSEKLGIIGKLLNWIRSFRCCEWFQISTSKKKL